MFELAVNWHPEQQVELARDARFSQQPECPVPLVVHFELRRH